MLHVGYPAALHPVAIHPERVGHYQEFKEELNFEGINFPVSLEDTEKFEKQNPTISVSVIGYEDEELFPIRKNEREEREPCHAPVLV